MGECADNQGCVVGMGIRGVSEEDITGTSHFKGPAVNLCFHLRNHIAGGLLINEPQRRQRTCCVPRQGGWEPVVQRHGHEKTGFDVLSRMGTVVRADRYGRNKSWTVFEMLGPEQCRKDPLS